MRNRAMLAAAAFALTSLTTLSAPAPALAYDGYRAPGELSEQCRDNRKGNTTKGALLGAAIGAAAGAGTAGRGSRGGGALIGSALGAGIGALAGRGSTSCVKEERAYGVQDEYGRRQDGYYERGYDLPPPPPPRYGYRDARSAQRCYTEEVRVIRPNGRERIETRQVCD